MRTLNKTLFLATAALLIVANAGYSLAQNDASAPPLMAPPSLPPLPSDTTAAPSAGNTNAGITESSLPPLPSPSASNSAPAPINAIPATSAPSDNTMSQAPMLPLPGEHNTASSSSAKSQVSLPEPQPLKLESDNSMKGDNKPVMPSEDSGKAQEAQSEPQPEEPAQNINCSSVAPKVKHKHHHGGGHTVASKGGRVRAKTTNTTKTRYAAYRAIKDRLPSEIYKKEYDSYNQHLPIANDEADYDKMMFVAAMHNDVNGIQSLMHTGRSANMVDNAGDTPLIVAVRSDAPDAARLLLVHNADPEARDGNGKTAMQIAEAMGDRKLVDALNNPYEN